VTLGSNPACTKICAIADAPDFETAADVARINATWSDCRGGPFLFGRFGAADTM
jgi:hypothetical protein